MKGGFSKMKNKHRTFQTEVCVRRALAHKLGIIALIAVMVFSMASCATAARVRTPMNGIESVIPGGTLNLRVSGDQVTVKVSSTEDGTGAVKSGTSVSASGVLTVDAGETAENLYVTATSAKDGTQHTLLIRVVTVKEVVINPATVAIEQGKGTSFSSQVNGTNNPNQNVSWTVGSKPDGTGSVRTATIIIAGSLSVATNETSPIYVKVTSDIDPSKSAVARVDVTIPQRPGQQPPPPPFEPDPIQPAPVGTWKTEDGGITITMTFNANGTGTQRMDSGNFNLMTLNTKWTASGNKLMVNTNVEGGADGVGVTNYTYEIIDGTLTWQVEGQRQTTKWTRQ
jgi:hypothetical protein